MDHNQIPPQRKVVEPPKKKALTKAAIRRLYGKPEFHYIQSCSHDVKRKGMCPLCKLIEKEAVTYLKEEAAQKDVQRFQGFFRQAEMRYGLVREWSLNQLYQQKDVLLTDSSEIVLNTKLGDCVGHFEDINKALDDIALNLRKRIRVLEVGNFAATYIQAKLRGYLCRRRMRRYLLNRFHYFAANALRKAYFLDEEKGSRYKTPPALIKNERPVSPTTMSRRLKSESKKNEKNVIKYENACKRDETYLQERRGGLWKVLEEDSLKLRQMIILRDVIYCAMLTMSGKRREKGERPTNRKSILPLGGPKGPHPSEVEPPATARITDNTVPEVENDESGKDTEVEAPKKAAKRRNNRYKRGQSTGDGLTAKTSDVEGDDGEKKKPPLDYSKHLVELKPTSSAFPYWFSLSNPAPPVRQLYLTLALQTPPLPEESSVELSPEELAAKIKAEKASQVVITADSLKGKRDKSQKQQKEEEEKIELSEDEQENLEKKTNPNALTLNERFEFLDKRIWSQMICFDAEDVMRKLSQCDDAHPAISSGVSIAEDKHRIWCGQISRGGNIPGVKARGIINSNDSSEDDISVEYSATDSESENDERATSKSVSRNNQANQGEDPEWLKDEGSIIPIQLQLHPFYVHREMSNMYRLFFIDGNIRAVSHSSPWTYYSDVYTYRASAVKAIATFTKSSQCIDLLNGIIEKANAEAPATKKIPVLRKAPSLSRSLSRGSSRVLDNLKKGSCMSIRLPDEKVLFDAPPELTSSELTSKEYKNIETKYSFLKKMFSWRKYKRYTKRHFELEPQQSGVEISSVELARQETAGSIAAGGSEQKISVMPPAEELMGSTIYKLCCRDVPQTVLSASAKQKLIDYSGANGYRALLKRSVNSGETLMKHCIAPPETNEHSEGLDSQIPPYSTPNLIVLDVFLKDNRAEEEELQRKLEDEAGVKRGKAGSELENSNRRASTAKPGRLPPMSNKKGKSKSTEKTPIIDLQIEIHHIVGMFSTSSERPPPAVDTGLFEWSELKSLGYSPDEVEEGGNEKIASEDMSSYQIQQEEKRRTSMPEWQRLKKKPQSGIFSLNVSMTSARTQKPAPDDTHMIEFRMLGKRPGREYLQEVVPLKIRKWLGMKY